MTDARKRKTAKPFFRTIALNKKARQNFKKEEFDHAFFQKSTVCTVGTTHFLQVPCYTKMPDFKGFFDDV